MAVAYPAGMETLYRRWEWAEEHIDRVCQEISAFLLKHPAVVEHSDDAHGNRTFSARVVRPVPERLSLVVGDALQAMRSPLDNLAWTLALKHTATPSDRARFPIADTAQSWASTAGQLANDLDPAHVAEMDAVQPYHSANAAADPLWQLHRLAIEDRHRALVVAFQVATTAMFTAWGPPGNKPNPVLTLGPIVHGQQVGYWALAGDWIQLGFPPITFDFGLAFDAGGAGAGRLICSAMLDYSNSVRSVLDRFQQFFP